jgi:transcription termination factor Rho
MAVSERHREREPLRKQDLIFALLKSQAKKGEASISATARWKCCPTASASLRSPETSYLASTRRHLRLRPRRSAASTCTPGRLDRGRDPQPPKDGERYFALVKVDKGQTGEAPEAAKNKILFENLTPLHPDKAFKLEREIKAEENLTGRVLDIVAPDRQGPARPDRQPAQGRQDRDAAAHRARAGRQPPRRSR